MIFFTTAGVAAGATAAVLFGGIEPRSLRPNEKVGEEEGSKRTFLGAAWKGICIIVKSTWSVFRIRSFQIILVAGIVGAIASVNNGYKIMYFQVGESPARLKPSMHQSYLVSVHLCSPVAAVKRNNV